MKKQIIVLVILIIAAAIGAYALVRHQAGQLSNQVPNNNENNNNGSQANNGNQQTNSAVTPVRSDSVAVSTQRAGNEVTIDEVKLSQPGFIAIHEVTDGKAGKIVASSKLLPTGTRQDVIIKALISSGKTYMAMLHADDDDGKFDPAKDLPVMSNGQTVMAMFNVTK